MYEPEYEPMDIEEPEIVIIHKLKTEQVGGDHYSKHKIQPWCVIDEYKLDYHLGNVIKYVLRDKGSKVEDIKKAKHYLEHWLEING